MAEKRQRISTFAATVAVTAALAEDGAHVLITLAEFIPIIGVAFTFVDFLISMTSFFGFFYWYWSLHAGLKRFWIRILVNIALVLIKVPISMTPYGGPILAFFIGFIFTITTILFIRAVRKDDKEYNEAEEKKEKELMEKKKKALQNSIRAQNARLQQQRV